MAKRLAIVLATIILMLPCILYAVAGDYLILQDIGQYKLFTGIPGRVFSGPPSKYSQTATGGVLDVADHFSGGDASYEALYVEPGGKWPFAKVEVTQHAGSESDKWLLHELDKEFRTYYGIPDPSFIVKVINGNTVYTFGSAGWDYRWLSGNKVIMIEYHDIQMEKSEPLEVVQAYLAKHPSTLPTITMKDLYGLANKTIWIKDEMARRLWLCDKWFMQLQLGKADEKEVCQEAIKSMNIFLAYREKYYGIKAADEKNLLAGYLSANNGTGIKAKLKEYKDWWAVNKDKAISL